MKPIYPPSPGRDSGRLEDLLRSYVHDVVRADPDSRHYQVFNPAVMELDRIESIAERLDLRPWRADVRQASVVGPADPAAPERTTEQLVYGKPDGMHFVPRRKYRAPTLLLDETGQEAEEVRVVERQEGELLVQAGQKFYIIDDAGRLDAIKKSRTESQEAYTLCSREPGNETLLTQPGHMQEKIASQIDGLVLEVAGRGHIKTELEFTGLTVAEDGMTVSSVPMLSEPLKLYNEDGEVVSYSVDNGALSVPSAGFDETFTLYYRGTWTDERTTTRSYRTDETLRHRIDLAPIADNFSDIPSSEDATAHQEIEGLAEVQLKGHTVLVTAGGYVGGTHVGHKIEHVLPGTHHVIVSTSTEEAGQLSIAEPEAQTARTFDVPRPVRGLTWTPDGLLAVITEEDGRYVVRALNEERDGRADGLTAEPVL